MTNDEFRMTNEFQITETEVARMPSHGTSSFVLRHSSFVITMAARLALVLVLAVAVSCSSKRITKANVDQVAEGMSKKQVESILGPPTSLTNEDFVIMKKTTYVYRQGKESVTIVFKDDKVQSKDSTLSD
jgi:outer membrane protein assembly factor BamE (lipoprotein component of BamABCDE complex)